jgi:hypothetical protein
MIFEGSAMKRLLSAALALSLMSGTAAFAGPYDHGRHHADFDRNGGRHWDRRHDDHSGVATAIGVGFGLFALATIIAASDRDRQTERAYDNGYDAPPPPQYRDGPQYRQYDDGQYQDQPNRDRRDDYPPAPQHP